MIETYKAETRSAIEKMLDAKDAIYKIKQSFESVTEEEEHEADFDSLDDAISSIWDAIYFAESVL